MQALLAHWGDLPAREQRILLLRFYGNMTQTEISEQLGMSQMHVSRLLARALSHLRACLYRTDGEASHGTVAAYGGQADAWPR